MGIMWTNIVKGTREAGKHALICMHAGNCREVCPMNIDITNIIQEIKNRYTK
jgi:L-lactate dehydrogenase complex protein LldG